MLDGLPEQRIGALVLAGDTLFAAGTAGGLIAVSAADGTVAGHCDSPAPSWDGLAAARGRLYLSGRDGTLVCFGP